MNIYLLNVGELIRDGMRTDAEAALTKVDEIRREKVISAKTNRGKAAELGAGLLLQKAVRDWKTRKREAEYSDGAPGSALNAAQGGKNVRSCFTVPCTLQGLLSELAEPLPLTYRYGEKGKPYFDNTPLFFNLSHSGEYVLCAVSRQEVGADIQKIQPTDVMKLAKRFFSEPECRALERCESDGERQGLFFGLWSRKEAYGKLTGDGVAAALKEDMQSMDVEWGNVSPPEGYALAVCRFKI